MNDSFLKLSGAWHRTKDGQMDTGQVYVKCRMYSCIRNLSYFVCLWLSLWKGYIKIFVWEWNSSLWQTSRRLESHSRCIKSISKKEGIAIPPSFDMDFIHRLWDSNLRPVCQRLEFHTHTDLHWLTTLWNNYRRVS